MNMRSIVTLVFVLCILPGCDQHPHLKQARAHAREQARINVSSFEHRRELRERQQQQLQERFEAVRTERFVVEAMGR
jgi:hypothetical protein